MERRIAMWGVIALLFLAVIYLTFKTGNASAATETVATTKSIASSSGMVGGCQFKNEPFENKPLEKVSKTNQVSKPELKMRT